MAHVSELLRPTPTRGRDVVELLVAQLGAVDAWLHDTHTTRVHLEHALSHASREALLDARRQQEVLDRQQLALIEHIQRVLSTSGEEPMTCEAARRAVVAHPDDWFIRQVSAELGTHGIDVVAVTGDGAAAVGIAVAEQPDFLVVGDRLSMLRGLDVIRRVVAYCPQSLIAAHVARDSDESPALDAGAHSAASRRRPVRELVSDLVERVHAAA